jgi:hypothetical protein
MVEWELFRKKRFPFVFYGRIHFLPIPCTVDGFALVGSFRDYPYKGMFPCFLGGLISVLFWVISRAWMSFDLVWRGMMISSI